MLKKSLTVQRAIAQFMATLPPDYEEKTLAAFQSSEVKQVEAIAPQKPVNELEEAHKTVKQDLLKGLKDLNKLSEEAIAALEGPKEQPIQATNLTEEQASEASSLIERDLLYTPTKEEALRELRRWQKALALPDEDVQDCRQEVAQSFEDADLWDSREEEGGHSISYSHLSPENIEELERQHKTIDEMTNGFATEYEQVLLKRFVYWSLHVKQHYKEGPVPNHHILALAMSDVNYWDLSDQMETLSMAMALMEKEPTLDKHESVGAIAFAYHYKRLKLFDPLNTEMEE